MSIVDDDVIKILIKNGYLIDTIEKIDTGCANICYKFSYSNKIYVAKCYRRVYNFDLSDALQDIIYNYNENMIIKNRSIINDKFRIEVAEFNSGKHIFKYNDKMIIELLNVINYYTQPKFAYNGNDVKTIYDKFEQYHSYFVNNASFNKVSINIIEKLNGIYDQLDINNFHSLFIVHGDLSYTNILWNNCEPTIIDFDECIYAEKEYELASFVIKTTFNDGEFNSQLAKKIIENMKSIIYNFDLCKLKTYIRFYILKVLYEKLYFYDTTDLDIESIDQKKDYWLWWYNLIMCDKIDTIL